MIGNCIAGLPGIADVGTNRKVAEKWLMKAASGVVKLVQKLSEVSLFLSAVLNVLDVSALKRAVAATLRAWPERPRFAHARRVSWTSTPPLHCQLDQVGAGLEGPWQPL